MPLDCVCPGIIEKAKDPLDWMDAGEGLTV
jgi:hypothetical protein